MATPQGIAVKKRKFESEAWDHFTALDDLNAKCEECVKTNHTTIIKTCGRSTSGLISRLKTKHGIIIHSEKSIPKKQCPESSPIEDMSRMAATDGLSFRTIAKSETIQRHYFRSTNTKLPTSPNTVRNAILKYAAEIRDKMKNEIHEIRAQQKPFTVTLDEWTSGGNRRYMNINLHSRAKIFNLGLARIQNSFTSEACLALLKERLLTFDVLLEKDVLAVVTDGAAVMVKFGERSFRQHQLCLAHGIHLAVVSTLYKKAGTVPEDDSVEDEEDDDSEMLQFERSSEISYHETISEVINKVRKIARSFHKSALKTEKLVKHIEGDSTKTLILDCRTRWNSLYNMLSRFLELKDPLIKAYVDLQEQLEITEEDFKTISDIVEVLGPVKIAAELICKNNTTLITADAALALMFEKLDTYGTPLSIEMSTALQFRVSERRTSMSDVASFLHFRKEHRPGYAHGYFNEISKKDLSGCIKNIYEMFYGSAGHEENEDDDTQLPYAFEQSLEDEFHMAIRNAEDYKLKHESGKIGTLASINRELKSYEATGKRGEVLDFVYGALLTVPPSTVVAERVFSSSNNFCTKLRTRLRDDSLDSLVYLRSYFQNTKE